MAESEAKTRKIRIDEKLKSSLLNWIIISNDTVSDYCPHRAIVFQKYRKRFPIYRSSSSVRKIVSFGTLKSSIRRELLRDEFVVMPNHFHGIVRLIPIVGTHGGASLYDAGIDGASLHDTGIDDASLHDTGIDDASLHDTRTHRRASLHNTGIDGASLHDAGIDDASLRNGVAYRPPKSVSSFIAGVKSGITKQINQIRKTPGMPVLQSRFHDHIIRDENELFRIRQYIKNNPSNWECDKLNGSIDNCVFEESTPYGEELWMI